MELDKDILDFYVKEHTYLVAELESRVQEARKLELAVLAGTPAVWAWLATNLTKSSLEVIWPWWIPFFFALVAGFRCLTLLHNIRRKSVYIKKIEELFCANSDLPGWRNHRDSHGKKSVTNTSIIFWLFFIFLTGILPGLVILP